MGAAFVNRPATTTLCWAIAASIIGINCSTAFESIKVYLPPRAGWLHAGAPLQLAWALNALECYAELIIPTTTPHSCHPLQVSRQAWLVTVGSSPI